MVPKARPNGETMEMDAREQETALRVYWMPGCTSCLRTKEFLT